MENKNLNTGFLFVPEGEHTLVIKKVYPEHLSKEEIVKRDKESPRLILHCFDSKKIDELELIAKEISKEHKEKSKAIALAPKAPSYWGTFFKTLLNDLKGIFPKKKQYS